MVELVEFIIKQFTDEPEKVEIVLEEDEKKSLIVVKVSSADMGKVIGKQGRIAKAMRTIVKAAAAKQGKKYIIEIVDREE